MLYEIKFRISLCFQLNFRKRFISLLSRFSHLFIFNSLGLRLVEVVVFIFGSLMLPTFILYMTTNSVNVIRFLFIHIF